MGFGLKRRPTVLTVASLGSAIFMVGLAWACTPQASIAVLPASGTPRNAMTIEGESFAPEPVEIRWNHEDGALLGTAMGPKFSFEAYVPAEAAPDFYYVVGIQRGSQGSIIGKATDTFQVKPEAGAAGDGLAGSKDLINGLWSGFTTENGVPGLADQASTPPVSERSVWPAGIGLAAVGSLGIGVAAITPALRRRRATAKS